VDLALLLRVGGLDSLLGGVRGLARGGPLGRWKLSEGAHLLGDGAVPPQVGGVPGVKGSVVRRWAQLVERALGNLLKRFVDCRHSGSNHWLGTAEDLVS